MGKVVCRQGDAVDTGHKKCDKTTTLAKPTQVKVFAEKKLIARLGDVTKKHTFPFGDLCNNHTPAITKASTTVFVGGKGVARVGDACDDRQKADGTVGKLENREGTVLAGE